MTAVLPILLLVCLGVAAVQATDGEAIICRRDWFRFFSRSEECLTYADNLQTWNNARRVCAHWYADFFYPIDNRDYNSALRLINAHDSSGAWVGVSRLDNGTYITADHQDYSTIWTGRASLTAAENSAGFLELHGGTPPFDYSNYYYQWYWWYWHLVWPKRHFICSEKACRIDCDRLCALIDALQALLDK